jgi:exodeoxyribonuclease VII small subunit
MAKNVQDLQDFGTVQARLDEIVKAVADEDIPLDDALDLYEEAVSLGMRASDLLEEGIEVPEDEEPADNAVAPEGTPASAEVE